MNNHFKTGILLLVIALSAVTILGMNASTQQPTTLIWSIPDHARDIAVSDSGGVIAVASYDPVAAGDFVKIFNSNGNMLWSWQPPPGYTVTAIDISGSGDEVAAAIYDSITGDSRVLFWKNAKSLRGSPEPDWNSTNLYGPIGMHALALSNNGNHLIAVGTGTNTFYWNNTKSMSGGNVPPTWTELLYTSLEYASISDNGNEFVAAGSYPSGYIYVFYFRNVTESANPMRWDLPYGGRNNDLRGASLSGDGDHLVYAVASLDLGISSIVYLTYDPQCPSELRYWEYQVEGLVAGIDINRDGSVIAVAVNNATTSEPQSVIVIHTSGLIMDCMPIGEAIKAPSTVVSYNYRGEMVYKYTDAGSYTINGFMDISIDDTGSVVAAGTGDYVFALSGVDASYKWHYGGDYPLVSSIVEVSGNGNYIVSGGAAIDSIYFFLSTPPPSVGGILVEPNNLLDKAREPGIIAIMLALSIAIAGAIALWYTRRV